MRAKTLSDLLKAGDRVAVSNITGREASKVSAGSQTYCGNIAGGWALGKGGQTIEVSGRGPIPVFSNAEDMIKGLSKKEQPNKAIVYSPPPAVYGEVKEIVDNGKGTIETIFVITEHVSIEVTAKIAQLCGEAGIDIIGCNTLGMINVHDGMRVGAVGGDNPADSFKPGSATIISNSGNMVNTMASYLTSVGIGTAYGVSTGKDVLILTSLKEIFELARDDDATKMIILYIEPGGLYEKEAVEMLADTRFPKPIIAYVAGEILGTRDLSLGHAGAVVEGEGTTAADKMKLFDDYFGIGPFEAGRRVKKSKDLKKKLARGIRIGTLHHLPAAAAFVADAAGIQRDFRPGKPLSLNPWYLNLGRMGKKLPRRLALPEGRIPEPYASQGAAIAGEKLGAHLSKRNMRNVSHSSSNDGLVTRIHGRSVETEMATGSFARSLILAWTGEKPKNDFEVGLLERCLIAGLTNGPGTISAQGAKLSTSAGNAPNTAMIATLACIGDVHGGNGRRAVEYLLGIFKDMDLEDPYDAKHGLDLRKIVNGEVDRFARVRSAAKEAGTEYARIPCLGHPVFNKEPVNYDPRERAVSAYLEGNGLYLLFLEFYHMLAHRMKEVGIARNVWAVNVDGAIASTVLAMCWSALKEKRMTISRACDIAFITFALGRAAGGASEYLDHQDFGSAMDMRIPVSECTALTRPKD